MSRRRSHVALLLVATALADGALTLPAATAQSQQEGAQPVTFELPRLVGGARSVSVRSPFPTLSRTLELAEGLARRAGYRLDYEVALRTSGDERGEEELPHRLHLMQRRADGGERRLDIVVDSLPGGGYEILLGGMELDPPLAAPLDGLAMALDEAAGLPAAAPLPEPRENADLTELEGLLEELVQLSGEGSDIFSLGLDFTVYQLSFVQSDRALALLKALGYQTIEYSWTPGETDFEGIFDPIEGVMPFDQLRLPVVIKVLDAGGQALPESYDSGYGGGTEARAMDLVTSGEPQQRLMVVYEPHQLAPVEELFNLLRDRIDVPARQVVIEAQVIEIDSTKLRQLGISATGGFGTQTLFDINPTVGASSFLFDEAGVVNDWRITLTALLETGDAELLSNPSVLVLDGRQARIEIGQLIPVATSESTGVGFSTSVSNQRVGILLNLRPRVSEGGDHITMQVQTDVSALIEQITQRDADGNIIFTAPQVDERRVESFVRVANDTPFIIGGLIATETRERVRGIPILSSIPGLGLLFRRTEVQSLKKEVIVVLTPHVVPADEQSFRFAIPKGDDIFDSFGHTLFRNAYRIRDDDAFFDLDSVKASDEFQELLARVREHVARNPSARNLPAIAAVLAGHVPGEEVLVRRLIWEVIRKTEYGQHVDPARIIYFEDSPQADDGSGFELRFLQPALERRTSQQNALVLSFDGDVRNTLERPLIERNASSSYESLSQTQFNARLRAGNAKLDDGSPDGWSIVLSDVYQGTRAPLETLRDAFVLQQIVDLNSTLEMTFDGFRPGRQIIFPDEQSLRDRFHAIDREIARYFYEVTHYYAAFQAEYRRQRAVIESILGDVEP